MDTRKSRNFNPEELANDIARTLCQAVDEELADYELQDPLLDTLDGAGDTVQTVDIEDAPNDTDQSTTDNEPKEETEKPQKTHAETFPALKFEKFNKWFNVIKFDDFRAFDRIMDEVTEQQRSFLFNGIFVYNQIPKQLKVKNEDRMGEFRIPLNIALASCSFNVIQRMLDWDIDMYKRDIGLANIIHVLIISASEKRQREDDFIKLLLLILKYLPMNESRKMLMEEMTNGYRPLELAARLGVFGMFREIMNLDGHLVERSFEAGMNTYSVYNLSDYESMENWKRCLRSPLRLLGYASPDSYESLKKYNIVDLQVIKRWYGLAFRRNIAILTLWWFLRILFNVMMVTIDFAVILKGHCAKISAKDPFALKCKSIQAIPSTHEAAAYFAVFWAFVIVVMDIIECIVIVFFDKERHLAYKGIRFKRLVAWTPFYRICQFLQVFLATIAPIAATIVHNPNDAFTCLLIIKALSLPLVMMSILYIVEPLPMLGGFAIALQQMVESIIAFIIFLLPVLITFAIFFQSVTPPKAGFVSMQASFYRLFMLEIGTYDFGQDPGMVIALVHITYYLVTGILLMNYLIAVMTSVINDTDEDREIMHFLRRLNLLVLAQERYGQWVWKAWNHFRGEKEVRVYAEEDDA